MGVQPGRDARAVKKELKPGRQGLADDAGAQPEAWLYPAPRQLWQLPREQSQSAVSFVLNSIYPYNVI